MAAVSSSPQWLIGFARERITPPLGIQMAGFDARNGVAESVHDDLYARALVLSDGATQTALVSVEVIALSAQFAATVRSQIEAATNIPAANVFLCATHTHCGPVTMNHFFNQGQPLDQEYLRRLAGSIVAAVVHAYAQRRARILKSGLVPCDAIAVNRRTSNGLPVDPYAGVLLLEEMDGTCAAIAVLYACHTTVLGPNTLSITQDFPYYTLTKLKAALGGEVEAIYFNGAEGDLSIGHKSDLSAVGVVDSFRTFETAQRLGERLSDAVLAGLDGLTVEEPVLQVENTTVDLPLKTYAPLHEMTRRREEALQRISSESTETDSIAARQRYLFARIEEYYAKLCEASHAAEPKTLTVDLSVIQLGNTVLITLPGEVFVRIALKIRSDSPFAKTMFLGLTNNYIGYVPDEDAAASQGYEVVASRVPWQAGELLQETAVRLLASISVSERAVAL
jgi:hypothetical protein